LGVAPPSAGGGAALEAPLDDLRTVGLAPRTRQLLGDYVELTKPTVQSLLLLTTIATMYVAGDPSLTVNVLAASLSFAGFLGYVFLYTVWLKRRTPQNIVIGGAAGAVPPLVGWAAVTGSVSGTAVLLFFIVFFWTPPHFWALSLLMKDEYAKVDVPMLPVVRGEVETRRQILLYTVLLYAVTQLPFCAGGFGDIYLVASIALGLGFIAGAVRLYRRADRRSALQLYLFSLAYLALLFCAMVADAHL
jgi:protoheme IX farnesyltransferase